MQVYPGDIVFLGKYRCKGLLGRGAFGSVHLVEAEGEELALKLIEKEHMSGQNEYLVQYLKGEVACMRQMKEEHCVALFDFQEDQKYFYLVIEYCEGGDLLALQQSLPEKTFPLKQALYLMSQVVLGVQALHQRGYLHRDIKPQNVLVKTVNGHTVLKVADFGFAKKTSIGTATVIGTEYFMSPEIYAQGVEGNGGNKYGFEVDVWACGVLLFYMLNACFPFQIQPAWSCQTKLQQLTKQAQAFSYRKTVGRTRKRIVENCTDEMEDLFGRMFRISHKERITFREMMVHPAFAGCFPTPQISKMATSEWCKYERERQVVGLMIQEMEFPAQIAERVYHAASTIGQLECLMFAYLLTKHHLSILYSFSKQFNPSSLSNRHPGYDWSGLFSSAYIEQIKYTLEQSIKTAKKKCQWYQDKCMQDIQYVCEMNEHLGKYLKDKAGNKGKYEQTPQDDDVLQNAYKWGINLVYRKVKLFLKVNKILKYYGLLSLVCICYIFKNFYLKEEPKKCLFAAYLNQQQLTFPIFSFKRFLEYSDRCKKEDYVVLAKLAIQRCKLSSIS